MSQTDTESNPLVKLHEGTRKVPKRGDILVQKMAATGQYVWGLVVTTEAKCGPATGLLLVYFSRVTSEADENPPIPAEEIKHNLVIAPEITNRQGWLRGFYKTVENIPFSESLVLPQHCFEGFFPGRYYNEFGEPLTSRTEPCSTLGVAPYLGLAEYIESEL